MHHENSQGLKSKLVCPYSSQSATQYGMGIGAVKPQLLSLAVNGQHSTSANGAEPLLKFALLKKKKSKIHTYMCTHTHTCTEYYKIGMALVTQIMDL